jgi:hypothetical protein
MATPLEQIQRLETGDTQLRENAVIPKFPYVEMPAEVVRRMPELKTWYGEFYAQVERWREETNIAIRGRT